MAPITANNDIILKLYDRIDQMVLKGQESGACIFIQTPLPSPLIRRSILCREQGVVRRKMVVEPATVLVRMGLITS